MGQDLESLREKVVTAEDLHVHRLAGAAALRREGQELANELYDQQVMARGILGAAFPDRGYELAAVSGTTPRNYKPLEEQVDQTVKLLREPAVELPTVKLLGVDITPGQVADGLDAGLQGFRANRTDYGRARKAVGESQVLLDQVIAEFKGSFPWIAQALEAFARLAGERELADRIRTSIRRVTRRQGETEEGEPDQASSDETSSDDTSSEEGSSDEASSDEASSEEGSSDEASSDEDGSDETSSDDTSSDEDGSDETSSDATASTSPAAEAEPSSAVAES